MDDAALVAAASAGDREAWGLVYDRYADKLHDHCWSILRDEHEAADALHDTFVKAAAAIGQLRDPSRLRPWLYAIARNEAYRRHRARARAVPTEDLGAGDDAELGTVNMHLDDDAGSPVEDLRRLVWDAAGGLSADDQALLDLHLRQGLEGEELAEAMGITANNAYVKLSRLRDTLERSLGALLVARTGSRECAELGALVADWDGAMSPLLRKRIARHIDGCETCGDRKKKMVSPLALLAGVPLLPAPAALRDRIIDDAVAAAATAPAAPAEPVDPGPPPPPVEGGRPERSPWGWILGAAAAAIVVVLGLLVGLAGGDDPDEIAVDGPSTSEADSTTTSSTSSTSSTSTTSTTPSTTSTTAVLAQPGVLALSGSDVQLGATSTQGTFRITNSGGSPLAYVLTTTSALVRATPATGTLEPGEGATITVRFDRDAAPEGAFQHGVHVAAGDAGAGDATVSGTVARPPAELAARSEHSTIRTSCGSPNTTTITATWVDESPVVDATLFYDSENNGDDQIEMTISGSTAEATLGPFANAEDEPVRFWVVVTDALGQSAESSHDPVVVDIAPC